MDLSKAIAFSRPGASWSLAGNTYAGLEWHDKAQSKPTLPELETAWAELNAPPQTEPLKVTIGALRIAIGRDLCIQISQWAQNILDPEQKFQAMSWWEYQPYVRRDHPVVEHFRAALGKTVEEVDAYFAAAKQLDSM